MESREKCRISVCMPTYNGSAYIQRQVETILAQLGEQDELVVSDDSSLDETLSILASFADDRIRVLTGCQFYSPIYNMENALKHAKGKYIFLTDQDDVWLPNKIEVMLEALKTNDLVVTDCSVIDSDEQVVVDSFYSIMNSGCGFWKNLYKNTYMGCCMAFRSSVLDYALPFPKRIPMHDSWIALCVEYKGGNIAFLADKCLLYRRHGKNASTCSSSSTQTLKKKLVDRLYLLISIIRKQK